MIRLKNLSASDKRELIGLLLWFAAGAAMLVMGIISLVNHHKALSAISGALGVCSLAAGIVTLLVRIYQRRIIGRGSFGLDWIIWFVIAFLLFNTNILSKLGKIAFIIFGAVMLVQGISSLLAALRTNADKGWYLPRIIFSAVFILLAVTVILNAEAIFNGMIPLAVGIYLIVQGTMILYEWIGRAKYFRNFLGLDR